MPSRNFLTMFRAFVRDLPIHLGLAMVDRLLDRQIRLIKYLTSDATLFGDEINVPADPDFRGFDRGLLRLEARFCRSKRIEKVTAVFPRTLEILGSDRWLILNRLV